MYLPPFTCKWLYSYAHTSYQSISLRKCGISEDPFLYYLAEVTDSSKGEERELKPDEHPYDIVYKGQGILKLYIRWAAVYVEIEKCKVSVGKLNNSKPKVTSVVQWIVFFKKSLKKLWFCFNFYCRVLCVAHNYYTLN